MFLKELITVAVTVALLSPSRASEDVNALFVGTSWWNYKDQDEFPNGAHFRHTGQTAYTAAMMPVLEVCDRSID